MVVNLSDAPLNPYDNPIFQGSGSAQNVITFNDIMANLEEQLLFKILVLSILFLVLELYLQYYCKNLQKAANRESGWREHVAHLNIEPIIENTAGFTNRDRYLVLLSDALFIPAVVFPLIFLGRYTGWFI